MSRLLSKKEIEGQKKAYLVKVKGKFILSEYLDFMLKAQLIKADKSWDRWFKNFIRDLTTLDAIQFENIYKISYYQDPIDIIEQGFKKRNKENYK